VVQQRGAGERIGTQWFGGKVDGRTKLGRRTNPGRRITFTKGKGNLAAGISDA